jgi:hypothetical protein
MCDESMMEYKFSVNLGSEKGRQLKIKYQE